MGFNNFINYFDEQTEKVLTIGIVQLQNFDINLSETVSVDYVLINSQIAKYIIYIFVVISCSFTRFY